MLRYWGLLECSAVWACIVLEFSERCFDWVYEIYGNMVFILLHKKAVYISLNE